MPIINKQPAIVKREYAIEEPVALVVERYAAFIQSAPDYVVNSALTKVLFRDAEFSAGRSNNRGPRGRGVRKTASQQGAKA